MEENKFPASGTRERQQIQELIRRCKATEAQLAELKTRLAEIQRQLDRQATGSSKRPNV